MLHWFPQHQESARKAEYPVIATCNHRDESFAQIRTALKGSNSLAILLFMNTAAIKHGIISGRISLKVPYS